MSPDFTKRNVGPQPEFDPVTGAPLPPGPAAYSAMEPTPPADPFSYPSAQYPSAQYPSAQPPTAQYPPAGYPVQPTSAPGYSLPGYGAAGQPVPGYGATGQPPAGYGAPGQPPPGYGAPGYNALGQPPAGYSAPGQPTPGYPAAGPPQGYPAGYAPIGYQMVPMYPVPPRAIKPGGATAAAVLAYVQSGFVLIGGVVMFSGSAGLDDFDGSSNLSSELTVLGIIAVLAGGLLIAGATTLLGRKPALLLIGSALSIGVSLYFVVRLMDVAYGIGLWVPILYAVLPIISVALASSTDVRAWARARTYDQE